MCELLKWSTKGDLFEHVLRQIKQAGELGQFRTPRHVIRAIVEMLDPKIGETIYDPAAGTAGFLAAAFNHIRLANSSPNGISETEVDGKLQKRGIGDRLSAAQVSVLQNSTFYGNDVDPKMVRLATMNLTLRGLANVRILLRNVLTTTLDNERKRELGLPLEGYHVVLANPPFSGRVDKDRIVDEVKVGTSTATELLFLKYMMDSLRPGGRCGVIVPEGVLFGSTGAHKELRRQLIENCRVKAVLSLPGGVFQPYSGVKTSVLFFQKGGSTDNVLFLHADNDGYKLDANHDTPIEADDLPTLLNAYRSREEGWRQWLARDPTMPVPPISEQRRIVDILSRAEGIVRLRREAEKKAAELIPALFLDMFGDPATNPKGWAVEMLPDVLACPFKNGIYFPKEKYAPEGSIDGVEMVHMSDAFYGEVKRGRLRRVLAEEKQIRDYGLSKNDLLVARRSLTYDGAAKLCGIPASDEPLLFESSFIRLIPDSGKVRTEYLLYYLNDENTRRAHVLSRISGITISGINQAALNQIPVMIPPLPIQGSVLIRLAPKATRCSSEP